MNAVVVAAGFGLGFVAGATLTGDCKATAKVARSAEAGLFPAGVRPRARASVVLFEFPGRCAFWA